VVVVVVVVVVMMTTTMTVWLMMIGEYSMSQNVPPFLYIYQYCCLSGSSEFNALILIRQ
jgi:hypothetical protein